MPYQIFLHPKADVVLKKLDKKIQVAVKNKIRELSEIPEKGEKLLGTVFWKIRAGDYRIIYEIETRKNRVLILFIGHRKHVYDDFKRLL